MSTDVLEKTHAIDGETKCHQCGAVLKFKPGTKTLVCEYCNAANEIADAGPTQTEEIDFEKFISSQTNTQDQQEIATVKCPGCGASTTLKPNVTADNCPFCATSLVVTQVSSQKLIKPKYLLPFHIEQKTAFEKFRSWLKGLWFAPSDLKKFASHPERLNGLYIPYWTYDSGTNSFYTGERGDDYYVNETYTTTENGKSVTKTRQVRKTRWTPVNGRVMKNFDDVLVMASHSLPDQYTRALEPWDLKNLMAFNEKFLSGFRSESYQIDVKDGFTKAKDVMAVEIRKAICQQIGGDHQRVGSVSTAYSDITFKHILLPIWLSAYRYGNKAYRFLVNGRTGEVQGERPWSWVKIAFAVLGVLLLIGVGILLSQNK